MSGDTVIPTYSLDMCEFLSFCEERGVLIDGFAGLVKPGM